MSDPEQTDQQQAVRDLLASVRHDQPLPEHVGARLDAALAELVAERGAPDAAGSTDDPVRGTSAATTSGGASVVDLSSRRRHRLATGLVAAAAVVVAGVGVGQVLTGNDSGGDTTTAAGGADSSTADDAPESFSEPSAPGAEAPAQGADPRGAPGAEAPSLDPATLRGDVERLLAERPASAPGLPVPLVRECVPGDVGEGSAVAVTYDGDSAVAVVRRAAGDTRRVDVFVCGRPGPVDSVVVPTR